MRRQLEIDNTRGERPIVRIDGKRVYVSGVRISIDVSRPDELPKLIRYDWCRTHLNPQGYRTMFNALRIGHVPRWKCDRCGTVWNARQMDRKSKDCLKTNEYGKSCGGTCRRMR